MQDDRNDYGRLIFQVEGKTQKKGLFKKTESQLAVYENAILIEEFGEQTELLRRNIFNIYFTAPMVGDYDCVTVEIEHLDEGEENVYTLDEDTWDGIFGTMDKLLNAEWHEFRESKEAQPAAVRWFNAVSAVVALAGEEDVEVFGGEVKSPENAKMKREVLFESWDVNGRQELFDWFKKLYAGRSKEQAQEVLEELEETGISPDGLNEGDKGYLEWMQSKYAVAWDMGRMIWIAAMGYVAEYLSYEEATEACACAGRRLQELFSDWDSMFHHYMQGYIFWSGEDPEDDESEAYQRIQIYEWLQGLPRSPYSIDWDTDLGEQSAPGFLLENIN